MGGIHEGRASASSAPDHRGLTRGVAARSHRRRTTVREYVWEAVEARLKHDLGDEFSAVDPVAMNERADPVLANLWNNPTDAAYDKL